MEALKGLRSCEELTKSCPENSKAGLEEVEAAVGSFEKSPNEVKNEDLEESRPSRSGRNSVMKKLTSTISSHWGTEMVIVSWLNGAAGRRRRGPREMVGSG
jgi:hypothetical protein